MFKFTLSSLDFNNLVKRLSSLSLDKDSVVSISLNDQGILEVFYGSKIEKGNSNLLAYEKILPLEYLHSGKISIYLSTLLNIKLAEYITDDKFPHCKSITLSYDDNKLEVKYYTKWSSNSRDTLSKFSYEIIPIDKEIDSYKVLFNDYSRFQIEFTSREFITGINLCGFIKTDVTSKESNGCLLSIINDNYYIVNTDSDIAVQYSELLNNNTVNLDVVISIYTLNAIKAFVCNSETFKLAVVKNQLYIYADDRIILLPILGKTYIIEDVIGFFTIKEDNRVADINLKPLITLLNPLVSKSSDIYKRIDLNFSEDKLNITSDIDEVTGFTVNSNKFINIPVNGSFFSSVCSKVLTESEAGTLYYDSDTSRITIKSNNNRLVFLIQGLTV